MDLRKFFFRRILFLGFFSVISAQVQITFVDVTLPAKGLTYRVNFGYWYRHRDRGNYNGSTMQTVHLQWN